MKEGYSIESIVIFGYLHIFTILVKSLQDNGTKQNTLHFILGLQLIHKGHDYFLKLLYVNFVFVHSCSYVGP